MSEFEDGLLPYMSEEVGDPENSEDRLSIRELDPDCAFDDPESAVDNCDEDLDDVVSGYYPKEVLGNKKIMGLRNLAEDSDPLIAALGHLGFASSLSLKRYQVAQRLSQARLPVKSKIRIEADRSRSEGSTREEALASTWYLAIYAGLSSGRYEPNRVEPALHPS